MAPKKNFYAVRRGHSTGVFSSWPACQQAVSGFSGAVFRGFVTRGEAEAYLGGGGGGGGGYAAPAQQSYAQPQYQQPQYQQPQYQQPQYEQVQYAPLSYAPSMAAPAYPSYPAAAVAHAHPYSAPGGGSSGSARNPRRRSRQNRSFHSAASSSPPPPPPVASDAYAAAAFSSSSSVSTAEFSASPPAAAAAAVAPVAAATGAAKHAVLFADGAAKSNPSGPCGAGGVLYSSGSASSSALGPSLTTYKKYLGVGSNNEAEYQSLILGMRAALAHGVTHLTARMDSQLVVRQMTGDYKVKAENLLPLYHEALRLASQFDSIQVQHVYRDQNAEADALANEAIQDALPSYGHKQDY